MEIPAAQAELIIAQMVSENRIKAQLDQRVRIVEFLKAAEGASSDPSSLALHTYNS